MIHSQSILKSAFSIIPHSSVDYRKFSGLTTNDFGISTHLYTEWRTAEGIAQPGIVSSFGGKCIELKDYKELGLDWSRRYITIWIPDVGLENATERNGSDQIRWNNRVFNVLQVENWDVYNGWQRCYCVEDKSETEQSS